LREAFPSGMPPSNYFSVYRTKLVLAENPTKKLFFVFVLKKELFTYLMVRSSGGGQNGYVW